MIPPLCWNPTLGGVDLLDQTQLPIEERWIPITTPARMAEAIRMLRIRGAPAIGIAAAYGVVLALRAPVPAPSVAVTDAIAMLATTRPTAVNLFYALRRMEAVAHAFQHASQAILRDRLLAEARTIEQEDRNAGRKLGKHGLSLFRDGMGILTHCHTGGVATSGYGTALAPLLMAPAHGMTLRAFVDETRPLLQGSRITAWELTQAGVSATLITDSMAGHIMQEGHIDAVIVGADRIAANGDVANKIGTYSLAVLAYAHEIPFYVSAPLSTIDFETLTGHDIVIEERDPREITHGFGHQTAPATVHVYNPAFDITPARLVTAIITEHGIIVPPYPEHLQALATEDTSCITTWHNEK